LGLKAPKEYKEKWEIQGQWVLNQLYQARKVCRAIKEFKEILAHQDLTAQRVQIAQFPAPKVCKVCKAFRV
jgi:hypothetical protein